MGACLVQVLCRNKQLLQGAVLRWVLPCSKPGAGLCTNGPLLRSSCDADVSTLLTRFGL
jgi:hypothetical protein